MIAPGSGSGSRANWAILHPSRSEPPVSGPFSSSSPTGGTADRSLRLEDKADGVLSVYTGDSLDLAVQGGIVRGPISVEGEMLRFEVCDEPGQHLVIQSLTAAKTTSAPDYYKHMLGWNRKAIRVILPTTACAAQVRAAEAIYSLAMEQVTG